MKRKDSLLAWLKRIFKKKGKVKFIDDGKKFKIDKKKYEDIDKW